MYLPASLIAVSIVSAFVCCELTSLDNIQFEPDRYGAHVE